MPVQMFIFRGLQLYIRHLLIQELSYNNYLDADAAWNCVSEFESPTCVVVKHTNPCGVASRPDILEAYRLAVKGDPVSAFGGIVAFNTTIDEVFCQPSTMFLHKSCRSSNCVAPLCIMHYC